MRRMGWILALALAPVPVHGQTGTVTTKPALTVEGARAVVRMARAEAARLSAPGGAIAVVDDGGRLMVLERLDGTFAAAAGIAEAKARTAALFRRPTKGMEDAIVGGRTTLLNVADAPLEGGVPLLVDGVIVGAVGVSGAASADQDNEIAVAAAATPLTPGENSLEVLSLDPSTVATAFSRGAPLFEGPAYKIHASRRTEPGQAEIHTRDTDVIYVLEGRATLVTGGEVVDGRTIAPEEIRGASIRGGNARTLTKGAVLAVPAGTPHWFRDVTGPFLYYVVKVSN